MNVATVTSSHESADTDLFRDGIKTTDKKAIERRIIMRQELNDNQMEQVVGGTVRFNGTKVQFTVLNETYTVQNCDSDQANLVIVTLYAQYKRQGNRVFETKVKEAFAANGWL